jgi:hypothetical protein
MGLLVGLLALWLVRNAPHPATVQEPLPSTTSAEGYSFFVAGHVYGTPGVNNPGVHPPFKEYFPELNARRSDFGFFTGDIVISSTPADWDEIDADLAELTTPVHFVVGNHDISNRQLFESRYGPTYYSFEHEGDLFVVLDSELDPCNISGEQMAFLEDALRSADARTVFVLVHRLIWVTEDTPYYTLRTGLNSAKGYNFQGNFWSEVAPLLHDLEAEVYVIAGDVGVTWAMSLFSEQDGNIHLIASGMGGAEEENYLLFQVRSDGVEIQVQRLDGQPLKRETIVAYSLAAFDQQ